MKIAFDLRRIGKPGIGRYMKCLAESITALAPEHEYLCILPHGGEDLIHAPNAMKICPKLKYYSIREQFELPRILRHHKVDLLHSPHFLLPLVRPCPAIATIHDVIYLACPEDLPSRAGRLYYKAMMNACGRIATRLITDSEFSKKEIVRYLHVDPANVEVIYPSVDTRFHRSKDAARIGAARARHDLGGDFILSVGIYKQRKNHARLLRAFQRVVKNGSDAKLVIAGPMEEGESLLRRLARELGIAGQVVFTGFVDDATLCALYSTATACVCPSMYEGFGFTALEAMACGTPVACSSATSLPEVAGKAALYFDPKNVEEMSEQILRLLADAQLRSTLIELGHQNLQRFSWTDTATQTLAVYRNAVEAPLPKAAYA